MGYEVLYAGIYILALTVGVLCAFGITIIWLLFANSALEAVIEVFVQQGDDYQPESLGVAIAHPNARAVIISDLHVDRWHVGDTNIESLKMLASLLKINCQIKECIINGDLADFPERTESSVLRRPLGELKLTGSSSVEMISHCIGILSEGNGFLSIVLGNHDLSLHGLRNPHMSSALLPGNLKQVWDGTLLLKAEVGTGICVEHGHRYDPLLTLYTSYRMLDIARNAQLDQASDFYKQLSESSHMRVKTATLHSRIREGITRLRYRSAARFNQHSAKVVTYGHTHIPDRYVFSSGCTYVNTGSWEPNRGGYVAVATSTGELWGPYSI